MLPHRSRALFGLLFVNFLLFGGVTTIVGATLPVIIRDLEWSYLGTGLVLAGGSIGYFATTFAAGLLVERWGPRRIISVGLLVQSVGLSCFGVRPDIAFNLGALVLLGVGQGTTEVITNYSVIRMEPSGKSRLMNLMHSAFTLGAVSAPLAMGIWIDVSGHWRWMFRVVAAISLLILFALQVKSLDFAMPTGKHDRSREDLNQLVRQPILLLLALMTLLYVGVEMGISSWISEFFVAKFAVTPTFGAFTVSAFWLGILLGRVSTSLFYHGMRPERALLVLASVAAGCLLAALVVDGRFWAGLMFFGTGLGLSVTYPIGITITANAFRQSQGAAIGIVSTAGGLGACLFPFLMSALANRYDIQSGFQFYFVVTVAMVLSALGVMLLRPRKSPGT